MFLGRFVSASLLAASAWFFTPSSMVIGTKNPPLALLLLVLLATKTATVHSMPIKDQLTNDLELVAQCAKLSHAVYDPSHDVWKDPKNIFFGGSKKDSGALVVQDDRCIVVIRGTELSPKKIGSSAILDGLQNLETDSLTIDVIGQEDRKQCVVAEGMYEAWNDIKNKEGKNMEETIELHCALKGELVFTGHSQGGGAAQVGAIRFSEFKPRVITFGTAPVSYDDCQHLPQATIWNFVNTEADDEDYLDFDPIPFVDAMAREISLLKYITNIAEYRGKFFVLSPFVGSFGGASPTSIVYIESKADFTGVSIDKGSSAHSMAMYLAKINEIKDLVDTGSNSISTDGFDHGNRCSENWQCQEICGVGGYCSNFKEKGSDCSTDSDCRSGSCSGWWSPECD